jgi:hypothetical protein
MHFKKYIRDEVYTLYLRGHCLIDICIFLDNDLDLEDIEEIIDWMNEWFA